MRRKTWVPAGLLAVAGIAGAGGVIVSSSATQPAHAAQRPLVGTATVQKQELSATLSEDGTLTFAAQADGSPYTVVNEARGAFTALPRVGQVIRQGQVLYQVNQSPVVLLYGSTPAYRTLSAGMTGRDVAQLNADLVALGYATSTRLSPTSTSFGPATTTALEKLQAAVGLAQNGTLTLGQAVFEPTAVRVTALAALLGGSAEPGEPVLQSTSTTRQVQVELDTAQESDMAVGDRVTITLPDNQTTHGVVTSVGTVASCAASSTSDGSGPTSTATATDSCSSENSASSTPTINVDIRPSDPRATGTWDQAPVQVGITTSRVPDALVVPVTALVARANGGYAVEVVGRGASNHLVPVSLGLFDDADGLVQVTDSQLAAGQKVVVPST